MLVPSGYMWLPTHPWNDNGITAVESITISTPTPSVGKCHAGASCFLRLLWLGADDHAARLDDARELRRGRRARRLRRNSTLSTGGGAAG